MLGAENGRQTGKLQNENSRIIGGQTRVRTQAYINLGYFYIQIYNNPVYKQYGLKIFESV